jgi:hypothetical protein
LIYGDPRSLSPANEQTSRTEQAENTGREKTGKKGLGVRQAHNSPESGTRLNPPDKIINIALAIA